MVTLLHLLSYVGALTAFVFVTLSLASGLLWIAELIEEHSRTAKTVGVRAIYVIIVLHALLYITDGLPFAHTVFSIFCHLVYLQHFSSTWPYISLTSPVFLVSCLLVVVDHFIWFFHFANVAAEAKKYRAAKYRYQHQPASARKSVPSFMDVVAFFAICVWFIPLFLFLSLSANDNVIPSFDTSAPPSPMGGTIDLSGNPQPRRSGRGVGSSRSLMKSVLTPVISFIPRLGRSSGSGSDGLIAPRASSPLPQMMTAEKYSPWGGSDYSASSPPPPMFQSTTLGVAAQSASGRFTPPPRRAPSPTPPPRSRRNSILGDAALDDGAQILSASAVAGGSRRPPSRRATMVSDEGFKKDD